MPEMPGSSKVLLLLHLVLALYLLIQWLARRSYKAEISQKQKAAHQQRLPKPKTGDDCPFCRMKKNDPLPQGILKPIPQPWSEVKSTKGRKKTIDTQGQACCDAECAYYGITDASMHAIIGYGKHGKTEEIPDLFCQACQSKFTSRRHTPLYRLKTPAKTVILALQLLAEGMHIAAVERVLKISEMRLRVWLTRAGIHAEALHKHYFKHLVLHHLQLDELYVKLRNKTGVSWLWTVFDAGTKIVPVVLLAPRTQEAAYLVAHSLHSTLAPNCVPAFSSDGLKYYFYALTAHFGSWEPVEGKTRPAWALAAGFMHGQLKKSYRRKKLANVERTMLWGEALAFKQRLEEIGLSGIIQTAFVERFNLTLRNTIAPLARRNWGLALSPNTLFAHIHWALAYYHFARPHTALRLPLSQPVQRKGKLPPRRFINRSPAMAANLTNHIWSVQDILSYPLPEAWR